MGNSNGSQTNKKKQKEQERFSFVGNDNFINDINEHFELGKVLGSGASCSVYIGTSKADNKKYAVKQMTKNDEWNPKSFAQEYDFLSSLYPHDNILKYKGSYIDSQNFYIITELLTGGALFDRIRKMKKFTERKAANVLRTLIKTIKYCHSKGIVHRDLKPENIVYESNDPNSNIVLIDFGDAARVTDHEMYNEFIGTLFYLPPEIVRARHGWELKASDMWTIGVIAYVLVTGRPPFYGKDNKTVIGKITKGKYYWPSTVPLSRFCKQFIKGLLQLNPRKRYTPDQALKHPWLQEGNNSKASDVHLGSDYLLNINEFYSGNVLEKLIVTNVVHGMSKEQERILLKAFQKMDDKNKGYITKDELVSFFMKKLGSKDAAVKKAEQFFKMMDDDGDGKITFKEFQRAKTQEQIHGSKNFIKQAFDGLSGNQKTVKVDDFKKWVQKQDNNISDRQVNNIINNIDENGDGFIDFNEFELALKSMDDLTKTDRGLKHHE